MLMNISSLSESDIKLLIISFVSKSEAAGEVAFGMYIF